MTTFVSYSNLKGRERLIEVLPLEYPLSLIIDPCNICNFKCVFCPTGNLSLIDKVKRPKGKMPLFLFTKIIDDVLTMVPFPNKIKRLFLDKDGEPLLNEAFFDMVEYAKDKDVFTSVDSATNASYLDHQTIQRMIDSGLDILRISVNGVSNDSYWANTRSAYSYFHIKKNIYHLFNEKERQGSPLKLHVKTVGLETDEQKEFFFNEFKDISDTIHVETLVGWSHTDLADFTLGKEVKTGMDSESGMKYDRKICNLPFRTMSVNWNGMVSICCVDWTWSTIIGDLAKESLVDIWNGQKMSEFRKIHITGKRKENPACRNCHYIYGLNKTDELDGYEEKLKVYYGDDSC